MNKEEELMDYISFQVNELIIDINELDKKDAKTQEYTYKLFIIYQKLYVLKFNHGGIDTFFEKQKYSYSKCRTNFDCIEHYAKFDDYFQNFCNYLGINQLAELKFENTLFPIYCIEDYFKCIKKILYNFQEHIKRTKIIDCFFSIEKNIPVEKARELKQIFNSAKRVLIDKPILIQEAQNIIDKLSCLLLPNANIKKEIVDLNKIIENAFKNLEIAEKNKNRPDGYKIIVERAGYILYENKELMYSGKKTKIKDSSTLEIGKWILKHENGSLLTRNELTDLNIKNTNTQDACINRIRESFRTISKKDPLKTVRGKGWIVNIF